MQVVAELAKEKGFTDDDGTTPLSIRSLKFLLPTYVWPDMPAPIAERVPDVLLPWAVFSAGPPPEKAG